MHVADGDGGKVLRCVATDGHRLARIDADLPAGAEDMAGRDCPAQNRRRVAQAAGRRRASIAVSVSETKVRFATPEITLTSKVIDGTFPTIPASSPRQHPQDGS